MTSNAELPFLKTRLSIMMFLEFFIWGAWLPLIFGYLPSLGFNDTEQLWVLSAFNVSALIAMFFSNQFADRNFAAQKFLSFSQFVGGLAMLGLFWVRKPEGAASANFWLFFGLMAIHTLFYVPTISISNSIAFANLKDPAKEFGPIRMWGTIGWIAAAWPFVFILVDWNNVPKMGDVGFVKWLGDALGTSLKGDELRHATSYIFVASGVASLLLSLVGLTLPNTPPKPATESGRSALAWAEALSLLRHPFMLVLFIVTFLDATILQMYFFWTGSYLEKAAGVPGNWIMPAMSVGQIAEILTMAVLGYVLKSLGWRLTMVIGILGHAARFTVFAFFPAVLPAVAVNLVHGICYAFFFATVYIFVDEFFPKDIRSSAQGLFNMLILGVGPLMGNFLCKRISGYFPEGTPKEQFRNWFLVPAGISLFAALLLLLFFHPPPKKESPVPT